MAQGLKVRGLGLVEVEVLVGQVLEHLLDQLEERLGERQEDLAEEDLDDMVWFMSMCELCDREILPEDESEHHLIPRERDGNGGPTSILHDICHRQIHALFNNKELELFYNTIDKLKGNRDVNRFIKWIKKKPIDFNVKTRIRRKRRNDYG